MAQMRKVSEDPIERLRPLAGWPESWPTVDPHTLSHLVMWQCWNYGVFFTSDLFYAIKPLYAVFQDRCPVELRLQTEQRVVMGVMDEVPARALVPFQLLDG